MVLDYLESFPDTRVRGEERLKRVERHGRRLYRREEILHRETLSRINYANALIAFSHLNTTENREESSIRHYKNAILLFLKAIDY